MYQGKRTQLQALTGVRKYVLLGAIVVLVLAVSISATIAFLIDNDNSITNTFAPGQVTCTINEEFRGTNKTVVTVQNTGNIPAYIRVAVVVNKADANGNIVAGEATAKFEVGEGWVLNKEDGYYYYTSTVEPNTSTKNLLGSAIDLNGIQVTILAEAIQADGVIGTTPAVKNAWRVNPASLGGGANG